jgi:hypothetical protein
MPDAPTPREHEWINTPEARRRRNERTLFALDDILRALDNGRPAPAHALAALDDVNRESARAGAWRMIRRTPPDDTID